MPEHGLEALRRVAHMVIVLLLVSLATFSLLKLTPGNPAAAILGNSATPQSIARVDHQLGLQTSFFHQYGHWLWGAMHGNFGSLIVPPYGSVAGRIGQAIPVSLELTILAEILALLIAIPTAVASAARQGKVFDRIASGTTFGVLSVPSFVAGLILALVFAVDLEVLPRVAWVPLTQSLIDNLSHAFLPALTLALPVIAVYIRVLRAELTTTLSQEFITVARAKGLSRRYVLWRHALRPSLFSLMTVWGVTFGALLGGTAIVEVIFSLPGIGNELVSAVQSNDYPMVQAIVLIVAVVYVVMNAIVDVGYGIVNPSIRGR